MDPMELEASADSSIHVTYNPSFGDSGQNICFALRRSRGGLFIEEAVITETEYNRRSDIEKEISKMGFDEKVQAETEAVTKGERDEKAFQGMESRSQDAPPEWEAFEKGLWLALASISTACFGPGKATFDIDHHWDFSRFAISCGALPVVVTVPFTLPSSSITNPFRSESFTGNSTSKKGTMYLDPQEPPITLSLHLWKPTSLNPDATASPQFQLICELESERGRPKSAKGAFDTYWRNASWLAGSEGTRPTNSKLAVNREESLKDLTDLYANYNPTENDLQAPSLKLPYGLQRSLQHLSYHGVRFAVMTRAEMDKRWEDWKSGDRQRKSATRLVKTMNFPSA